MTRNREMYDGTSTTRWHDGWMIESGIYRQTGWVRRTKGEKVLAYIETPHENGGHYMRRITPEQMKDFLGE